MSMIKRLALGLLLLIAAALPAAAQTCAPYPFTFTLNTTIQPSQVNSNFTSILNCANASLAPINAPSFTGNVTMGTPLAPSSGGTPVFFGGTSTGAANVQVLASVSPANFSLINGFIVCWASGFANSGSTTLNVNGTGNTTLQKVSGGALANLVTGDLLTGKRYCGQYDGSVFEVWNPSTTNVTSVNVVDATNGGLNCTGGPITSSGSITCKQQPSDLLTKATPTASDSVVIMDAAAANAAKTALSNTLSGTLKAGTQNVLNPLATSANNIQAHGLGAKPDFVNCYIENLSGELGYSAGDRVMAFLSNHTSFANEGISARADATNTYILTGSVAVVDIVRADTNASAQITPGNWKAVCTPFKIN